MKRLCLFAHYDRDGIIDDYVVYYLKGLRTVCDRIIFVSDCELADSEKAKIAGLSELVAAHRHGEYDFGSWKRGFQHVRDDLAGYDELVLANDSCYAPIYNFEGVFERMQDVDADIWAPTATLDQHGDLHHLNSYFLVLKPSVFTGASFDQFMDAVKKEETKEEIIAKYELGFTRLLIKQGFHLKWLHAELDNPFYMPLMHGKYYKETIHTQKLSWSKVVSLRENPNRIPNLQQFLTSLEDIYPAHLIINHITRFSMSHDLKHLNYNHNFLSPHSSRIPFINKTFFRVKMKRSGWLKYYLYIFGVKIPVFALHARWFAAR